MRIAKLFGAGLPRQRALVALVLLAGLAAALWLDAAHAQQADLAAPTGLAVEETSDSLTLSWAAVEDATGYEVRLGASGEVEAATGLSHEFTDLDDDTDYLLHVRAIDTTSSSSWASLSGRTLDPDLALPPQMVVRLYNSTPDVVVNWYHTPDATGYELRLDREGELVEMFTTTAYWHRYEDLPRDTQHRISVRSTKGSSRSAWLSKQFRTMRPAVAAHLREFTRALHGEHADRAELDDQRRRPALHAEHRRRADRPGLGPAAGQLRPAARGP